MSQYEVKRNGFADILVEIIATGAFFAFMAGVVLPAHVPSSDPKMVTLWSIGSAACMSGVFWLALWMLRVVYRYQRELNQRR